MSEWIECICGADIRLIGETWIGIDYGTFCYPDSKNRRDREARHEPGESTP